MCEEREKFEEREFSSRESLQLREIQSRAREGAFFVLLGLDCW
jgi:hypothetical protein